MRTRLWNEDLVIKIKVRALAIAWRTQLVTSIALQSVAAYWHGLMVPQCIVQPSIPIS